MYRWIAIVALLVCTPATAQVSFNIVRGEDNGTEAAIQQWYAANTAGSWWSWITTAWDDQLGSFVYVASHHKGGGMGMERRLSDGMYFDVTPTDGSGARQYATMPSILNPIMVDLNNDGLVDMVNTGYTTGGTHSLIRNADGTWTQNPGFNCVAEYGLEIVDANNDGFADLRKIKPGYGSSSEYLYRNDAGVKFTRVITPVTFPSDTPAEVMAILATRAADTSSANRFCGPKKIEKDIDGDGDVDLVATYIGGYAAPALRFTFVCLRDANGLSVVASGLPEDGTLVDLLDINEDGLDDAVMQYGDGCGVYIQTTPAQFTRATGTEKLWLYDDPHKPPLLYAGSYQAVTRLVDFDLDGDLDMLIDNPRVKVAMLFEQISSGAFDFKFETYHWDAEGIAVHDIDLDGDDDIVIGGPGPDGFGSTSAAADLNMTFYVNQAVDGGPVDPPPPPPPPPPPTTVIVTNIDGQTVETESVVIMVNGQDETQTLLDQGNVEIQITTGAN